MIAPPVERIYFLFVSASGNADYDEGATATILSFYYLKIS
jgi:hypothetical protein